MNPVTVAALQLAFGEDRDENIAFVADAVRILKKAAADWRKNAPKKADFDAAVCHGGVARHEPARTADICFLEPIQVTDVEGRRRIADLWTLIKERSGK